MKTLFIFDIDGVVVKKSSLENLSRDLFKLLGLKGPPRIFLGLGEIVLKFKQPKPTKLLNHLKGDKKDDILIGIITDRSLDSLLRLFQYHNIESILNKIDFLQVRKSFFRILIPCVKNFFVSSKIKPHAGVYDALISFVNKLGIKFDNVVIIEDNLHARYVINKLGFKAVHPDDPKLPQLLNPNRA